MQYLIVFLEGIVTFISPCLLPMLPLYISYFAGGSVEGSSISKQLKNSFCFVLGFTIVFVSLGGFAGTLGKLVLQYNNIFNMISGSVIVLLGISYLGLIKLPNLPVLKSNVNSMQSLTPLKSLFFGFVFSISWTPCVSAFLGSALVLASQQGSVLQGILMLLLFSAGLGIPFIISALLIDNLKSAIGFLKTHSKIINNISGILLILMGILLFTGRLI